MTTITEQKKAGPVEVWLTQKNMEVTCMTVREDESYEYRDVDSLSVRGAQREMTGWLIANGYIPAGRWEIEETEDGQAIECVRRFKPGDDATCI